MVECFRVRGMYFERKKGRARAWETDGKRTKDVNNRVANERTNQRLICVYNFISFENLALHKYHLCPHPIHPCTRTHTISFWLNTYTHSHTHLLCFGYPIPCDDAYVIENTEQKNRKHSTAETTNGYRASHWFCALTEKHIVCYKCALIIRLRYHSFDFIFFSEAIFWSWRIRWSTLCVFSFFRFHLSFFFCFYLHLRFVALCFYAVHVFIHLSRSLSLSRLLSLLFFCIFVSLLLWLVWVRVCVCVCVNVYLYRSLTALSQKVASVLFATSWLPSKYSVDCTYIWKTFVWSSMKLCNSFFSSSLFCSFCPWFFRSAIAVLLFFIYLFCFMHLWACSLALPFLLPLTHTHSLRNEWFFHYCQHCLLNKCWRNCIVATVDAIFL